MPFSLLPKNALGVFCLSGLLLSVDAMAQSQLLVQADLYSEPLPIQSFIDEWQDPHFKTGKVAFAQGIMEIRQQQQHWQYGLVWNYDYLLKFTPDTATLYYQIQNDLPLDSASQYDLGINVQYIESAGFRLGRVWQSSPDWQITTGISLLQGRHFLHGNFEGQGNTGTFQQKILNQVNAAQASLNYFYDRPALHEDELGWNPKKPLGYGMALDVELAGQITPEIGVNINMRNALAYMRWDKAPNSAYRASYKPERLPSFDIQGRLDNNKTLTQRIPYQLETSLHYHVATQPLSFSITHLANPYTRLWQLNSFYQLSHYQIGVHAEPQTSSYGLSLQHKNFGMRYMTDDLNTNQAKRLSVGLYAMHEW